MNYKSNWKQEWKEQLNGINTDQKCVNKIKRTI